MLSGGVFSKGMHTESMESRRIDSLRHLEVERHLHNYSEQQRMGPSLRKLLAFRRCLKRVTLYCHGTVVGVGDVAAS